MSDSTPPPPPPPPLPRAPIYSCIDVLRRSGLEVITNPPTDDEWDRCSICLERYGHEHDYGPSGNEIPTIGTRVTASTATQSRAAQPLSSTSEAVQFQSHLADTTVVRVRRCNHIFHRECLLIWLEGRCAPRQNQCPYCRTVLFNNLPLPLRGTLRSGVVSDDDGSARPLGRMLELIDGTPFPSLPHFPWLDTTSESWRDGGRVHRQYTDEEADPGLSGIGHGAGHSNTVYRSGLGSRGRDTFSLHYDNPPARPMLTGRHDNTPVFRGGGERRGAGFPEPEDQPRISRTTSLFGGEREAITQNLREDGELRGNFLGRDRSEAQRATPGGSITRDVEELQPSDLDMPTRSSNTRSGLQPSWNITELAAGMRAFDIDPENYTRRFRHGLRPPVQNHGYTTNANPANTTSTSPLLGPPPRDNPRPVWRDSEALRRAQQTPQEREEAHWAQEAEAVQLHYQEAHDQFMIHLQHFRRIRPSSPVQPISMANFPRSLLDPPADSGVSHNGRVHHETNNVHGDTTGGGGERDGHGGEEEQ